MVKRSFLSFAALCATLFCSGAVAQSDTATVTGRITDQSGAVVAGVEVQALRIGTNTGFTTQTNAEGLYSINGLRPGPYRLIVRKTGFHEIVKADLVLQVQDVLAQNFALQVGSVEESITVTGLTPLVNAESAAVGTVVDRQFIENIPLNGRSLQSLISLTPGVTAAPPVAALQAGEFTVNGQRTEQNLYMVDGVSANTGTFAGAAGAGSASTFPGITALGTTQSLVSLDALQEFRIQTSTYSAEYGRVPGGQISMVTRSGTNDWHGSAYEYIRNSVFDAANWFNDANNIAKTVERQNDFGGTLGGPVRIPHVYDGHNKTFFFFSYEGLRLASPQPAVTYVVPSMTLRQNAPPGLRPILNAFPIPNGPLIGTTGMAQFIGAYSAPGLVDSTAIKIDQTIGNKTTVFARFSDSPSNSTTRVSTFSQLSTTVANVNYLTLGATTQITPRMANDARFNATWNRNELALTLDNSGGAAPLTVDTVQDFSGQPTPGINGLRVLLNFGGLAQWQLNDQINKQHQYNFVDGLSYVAGQHRLKFGIDFRHVVTTIDSPNLFELGEYTSQTQVLANTVTSGSLIQSRFGLLNGPLYDNYSLYAQDEWKVRPRLTLSLGLRWDVNPSPGDVFGTLPYTLNEVSDLKTAVASPKNTPLWKTTYNNFAPRFGVAYQLRQQSGYETVLRGGFGVFYDTGNDHASTGYSGIGFVGQSSPVNVPFPFTSAQLNGPPPPSTNPPYASLVAAYDPNLKLPYTLEWNVAVQQGLGKGQALTVSYVGAAGRRQILTQESFPSSAGNTNFAPGTGLALITTNGATSDYDALQAQFQKRLSQGLQVLASYTWSHSIDITSTNATSTQLLRGSSDYDIRQNFQAALTYDVPWSSGNALANAILRHWSMESRVFARSALPFDISGGSVFLPDGLFELLRADVVPGQPVYLSDPHAPGGRRVNFSAFTIPTAAEQAVNDFGNAPRNFLRAFDLWQADLAVRREFPIKDRLKLQFRAEAFNIFNHPNFGAITNTLTSGATLFGVARGTANSQLSDLNPLYQVGGPRSLQFTARVSF